MYATTKMNSKSISQIQRVYTMFSFSKFLVPVKLIFDEKKKKNGLPLVVSGQLIQTWSRHKSAI